jgi:hypothetical protein
MADLIAHPIGHFVRKQRTTFTTEQKLDYAKLMVNENYTNKQIT